MPLSLSTPSGGSIPIVDRATCSTAVLGLAAHFDGTDAELAAILREANGKIMGARVASLARSSGLDVREARETAMTLEKAEVVSENGKQVRRYMRALPTQELCMNCHGPVDKMTPAVIAKLKALYPEDRGTGYTVGQIRGAMTIRQPQ